MAALLSSELEVLKIQDNLRKVELSELVADDSALEARIEVAIMNSLFRLSVISSRDCHRTFSHQVLKSILEELDLLRVQVECDYSIQEKS